MAGVIREDVAWALRAEVIGAGHFLAGVRNILGLQVLEPVTITPCVMHTQSCW